MLIEIPIRSEASSDFAFCLRRKSSNGYYHLSICVTQNNIERHVLTEYLIRRHDFQDFATLFPEVYSAIAERVLKFLDEEKSFFSLDNFFRRFREASGTKRIHLKPGQDQESEGTANTSDLLAEINERVSRIETLLEAMEQTYLTIDEAAKFSKVAVQTLSRLVYQKKIPHIKKANKVIFKKSELINWLEDGRVMKTAQK